MKKTLLVLAFVLLGTLADSRAEVLIYKGAGTSLAPVSHPFPPTMSAYLVVDIPSEAIGLIYFYKKEGQKRYLGTGSVSFAMTTAAVQGGFTARVMVEGASSSPAPNFSFILNCFRGIQKNLIVATGAVDTIKAEPRVMFGSLIQASESGGTGALLDVRLPLRYQQLPTIKANNASRTLSETLTDLTAKLNEKGYELDL